MGRIHLDGVPAGRPVSLYRIDPATLERIGRLAEATTGAEGWVDLPSPLVIRAGEAFIAVVEFEQGDGSRPHPAAGWPRLLVAAGLVLGVAALAFALRGYFSWSYIREHLDDWRGAVARNRALSVAVFFAVYVAVTALSLPAALPLTLLGAVLFDRWLGTAVVSLAATLGATLALLSSRYLLRDWVQRRFAARLEGLNRGVARDGAFYLFTLRLVPAVPFFLINLGMGLTPMPVLTYALVSWLGMLPGTFLYVNAGSQLATLDSPSGLLSPATLASLALLGVVPLAIRKLLEAKPWRRGDRAKKNG